ncbi:N-acetylmuramidase domain-containing protein [Phenylobacterium sp. LjRoot225]|uniref:N-acetylmuramidase domain-containing protein n=1 Tax=Phenylobacterium sp. LjRoot225 TaxID=3342285 RepID=UPI003ECE5BC0
MVDDVGDVSFKGAAKPLSEGATALAARTLACDEAAIQAVIDAESHGGFLADGRPRILFERHYFRKLTNGAYDAQAPDISNASWGGYKGGAAEYVRLQKAFALAPDEALKSASWGAFQIMGANYQAAGYADVRSFCDAMCASEDNHLQAFVNFVQSNGLSDELRRRDWAGFARGYNGPDYARNKYDAKLAAAYALHAAGGPRAQGPRPLRMGDEGPDVVALQQKLGLTADGDFGPTTRAAVVQYQQQHGLLADGIVGAVTRAALGL